MENSVLVSEKNTGAVISKTTKGQETGKSGNGVTLHNPVTRRYAMIRYIWQIPEADAVPGFLPWSDTMLRAIFTNENGTICISYGSAKLLIDPLLTDQLT